MWAPGPRLGLIKKGPDRVRVFFKSQDIKEAQETRAQWSKVMGAGGDEVRVYGEQWFPLKVDRVKRTLPIDEVGRTLVEKLNQVKIAKMRWLS